MATCSGEGRRGPAGAMEADAQAPVQRRGEVAAPAMAYRRAAGGGEEAAEGLLEPRVHARLKLVLLTDRAASAMSRLAGHGEVIGVNTAPTPDEIIFDNDTTLAGAAQCGNGSAWPRPCSP